MTADWRILDGLRVIDGASFVAAPAAALALADFGADVIKIEPPGGDPYRSLATAPGLPQADVDYLWQLDNRGKRSLQLDLNDAGDRNRFEDLVKSADVYITNRPGASRRANRLTYGDLSPLNPRLIYASMTAYGERGEDADSRGFDVTAYWARSGLMHQVRAGGADPSPCTAGMGDHPASMTLFAGILLALIDRQRTGEGREVTTSLLANGVWSNAMLAQGALVGAEINPVRARSRPFSALVNYYRASDDSWFMLVGVEAERDWPRLLEAIERPAMAKDPRFATADLRRDNAAALVAELEPVFAARPWPHWRTRFHEAKVPCGPVQSIAQAMADPQTLATDVVRMGGPDAVVTSTVDTPIWVGAARPPAPRAPRVDEHGEEIRTALRENRSPWRTTA